jgi:polyphosphate kinase 2 (PPK2 family)
VKVQKDVIKHGHKVLVIFEGRDASGKDGTIKSIVEHLSPRETRVVALGKPSDRDDASWYFQRFVPRRRNWCSSIAVGSIGRALNT